MSTVTEQQTTVSSEGKLQTPTPRRSGSKPLTFNTYIHRALKIVRPDINIAKTASRQLDSFIKICSARISTIAIQLAHSAGRHTVSVEDVETATQLVLFGELCENAMTAAAAAVERYDNNEGEVSNKAVRSGLSFPPHISEKFLRLQDSASESAASKLNVGQRSPVYMAAAIEYITAEILELAGQSAIDNNRLTITVRHLLLATHNNLELCSLLENLNFNWLGGGVFPYLNPAIIPSKEKQRKLAAKRRKARTLGETPTPTPGVGRKSLPGAKALRDIRRYQKTTGLLQRKEHFKRFVKAQVAELSDDSPHFGAGVIDYLQLFVEDQISRIFKDSVRAMIHADHETVKANDVALVWSLVCPNKGELYTGAGVENLAQPGIQRLARRGGVKLMGSDCYPVARDIMAYFVSMLLRTTLLLMQRQKNAKTVTLQFLERGAAVVGFNLPIESIRRRTRKTTTQEEEDISEIEEVSQTDDE